MDQIRSAFVGVKKDVSSLQEDMHATKEVLALLAASDSEESERITRLEKENGRLSGELDILRHAYVDLSENILDYLDEINRNIVKKKIHVLTN